MTGRASDLDVRHPHGLRWGWLDVRLQRLNRWCRGMIPPWAKLGTEPDNGVTDAAIDRILGGGGICFLTTIRAVDGRDAAGAIASALARGDCWSANMLIAGREFARRCRRVAGCPTCLACHAPLTASSLATIFLLCRARPDADEFLPAGFCRACTGEKSTGAVDDLALAALEDLIGRDLREIVLSPAGRA